MRVTFENFMNKPIQYKADNKGKNVVVANTVTRAAQGLTLVEKRILFCGIAKLGGINQEVKLTAEEYANTFDTDIKNAYGQLKNGAESFRKKYLKFQIKDGKAVGTAVVNWLQGYLYFDNEGYVRFRFSEYITPFLFELEREFTKYQLKQTSALRSIHSWRLLELFEQHNEVDKDGMRWLKISIDEFHHAMESPESYKTTFGLLRKYLIEPAVKELTEKDRWVIQWTPIKTGRKVTMLEFKFKRDAQKSLF